MKTTLIVGFWIVTVVSLVIKEATYIRSHVLARVGEHLTIESNVERVNSNSGTKTVLLLEGIWIDVVGQTQLKTGSKVKITAAAICANHQQIGSLRCEKVRWEAKGRDITIISERNVPTVFIEEFRLRIQAIFHGLIPGLPGELFSSIVIGGNDLPASFKKQLSRVGLSHVVAASGMNVTLLAGGLSGLVSVLKVARKYKVILMIGLITLYSGITGFDPPIVRAAIMASVVFITPLLGRSSSSWVSLFITAILMLWADSSLLINFGFLLSFGSMIGQIAIITLDIKVTKVWGAVIEILLQTIAAILATLPIVVIGFSQFSLISIVTNVLSAWVVEPLMLLGVIVSLLGIVSLDLARLAALPAVPLLDYFFWIVKTFDRPEFVLALEMHWLSAAGYYLVVIASFFWLRAWIIRRRSIMMPLDSTIT